VVAVVVTAAGRWDGDEDVSADESIATYDDDVSVATIGEDDDEVVGSVMMVVPVLLCRLVKTLRLPSAVHFAFQCLPALLMVDEVSRHARTFGLV